MNIVDRVLIPFSFIIFVQKRTVFVKHFFWNKNNCGVGLEPHLIIHTRTAPLNRTLFFTAYLCFKCFWQETVLHALYGEFNPMKYLYLFLYYFCHVKIVWSNNTLCRWVRAVPTGVRKKLIWHYEKKKLADGVVRYFNCCKEKKKTYWTFTTIRVGYYYNKKIKEE